MTPDQAKAVEALRDADAAFRMSVADQAVVVGAAVDLLVVGVSTPGVIALAGDDHAEDAEVLTDLATASSELGLGQLSREQAAVRAARSLAVGFLVGEASAIAAARNVWRVFVESDYASGLAGFANIADGLEDVPEFVSEADFHVAALDFVRHSAEDESQPPTG